jgi:hypothetical protein
MSRASMRLQVRGAETYPRWMTIEPSLQLHYALLAEWCEQRILGTLVGIGLD